MILVAGAGVFGASIALVLAQAGAEVTLADPAAPGDNASGVAAGMLAPAFEAVLDPPSAGHFDLLRQARERWPTFGARLGGRDIGLSQSGAVWAEAPDDDPSERAGIEATLSGLGAAVSQREGLLFTPEDWRLDAPMTLAALWDAGREAGVRFAIGAVEAFKPGRATLTGGEVVGAETMVLAIGASEAVLPPELTLLAPISGQILHFASAGHGRNLPTIRFAGGYRVDGDSGVLVGATMEPGRRPAPSAAAALKAKALARFPELVGVTACVHVRRAADGRLVVAARRLPGGGRAPQWLAAGAACRGDDGGVSGGR
jgi:glycine oxidase